MPIIRTDRVVSLDDAEPALAETLGPAYHVSRKPGARPALSVRRNALIRASVRADSSGGGTTFRVSGDGLIVLKLVNTPTIARTVGDALERLYANGAAAVPTAPE